MKTWSIVDAQDSLDHLFQGAVDHQPQRIETGSGAVVMMSADDYDRLASSGGPSADGEKKTT